MQIILCIFFLNISLIYNVNLCSEINCQIEYIYTQKQLNSSSYPQTIDINHIINFFNICEKCQREL